MQKKVFTHYFGMICCSLILENLTIISDPFFFPMNRVYSILSGAAKFGLAHRLR